MPTTAPISEKKYTLAPAGTHLARVYKFMNLGTRFQEYQGQVKDYPDTLINITLELPNEMNEFEVEENGEKKMVSKPFVISREFTLSMGKKSNLRPFVEGILGTALTDGEAGEFDLESLVGMTCQATIVHEKSRSDPDRKYAKLVSVAPLMKGVTVPEPFNEPVIQDVKTMTLEEIEALPEFLRKKIEVSDEYRARFDEDEIARKKALQEEINKRTGKEEYPEEEINPEDIPF